MMVVAIAQNSTPWLTNDELIHVCMCLCVCVFVCENAACICVCVCMSAYTCVCACMCAWCACKLPVLLDHDIAVSIAHFVHADKQ